MIRDCRCHTYPHHPDLNPCPPCTRAIEGIEQDRDDDPVTAPDDLDPFAGWNWPPGDTRWADRIGA